MKVVILTQQDRFFIPKNIEKVLQAVTVLEVVNVSCKSSLDNRPQDFLRWFGIWETGKMAAVYAMRALQAAVDRLTGYRLWSGRCSVEHIAVKHGVPYRVIKNVNDRVFYQHLTTLAPDLIVSFSAPQVIKEPLLSLPRYGIINVHGSILPDYRGCLPSFWHLYNGEAYSGATVHYMSAAIDDGAIIVQDKVSIEGCRSMFEVMEKTKVLGGNLMLRAISLIENGKTELVDNDTSKGRYFSWPTVEQGRDFVKRGYSLI